jgi:hypothetical protein
MRTSLILLICLLVPHGVQAVATTAAVPDSLDRDARIAMGSSIAFPALGQLYTGGRMRTLSVYALEVWCLSNILREGFEEDRYRRRASELGFEETWMGYDLEQLEVLADSHQERKKDFIWRLMPVMIYSLLDAFVSAHLFNFDIADLREPQAAILPVFDGDDRIGLQFRLSF